MRRVTRVVEYRVNDRNVFTSNHDKHLSSLPGPNPHPKDPHPTKFKVNLVVMPVRPDISVFGTHPVETQRMPRFNCLNCVYEVVGDSHSSE